MIRIFELQLQLLTVPTRTRTLVVVLPAHPRVSLLPNCRTRTLPLRTPPYLCTFDAQFPRNPSFASNNCGNGKKRCVLFLSCVPRSLVRWLPRCPAAAGRCDANPIHPIGRRQLHRLRTPPPVCPSRTSQAGFQHLALTKSRCKKMGCFSPAHIPGGPVSATPTPRTLPSQSHIALVGEQPHPKQRRKGRWRV